MVNARFFMLLKIQKFIIFIFVFFLVLNSVSAQAQENYHNKDSLLGVLEETYQNNPTIKAARAELSAVRERVPQAYANFQPTINADAGITSSHTDSSISGGGTSRSEADGSTSKNISLDISQPVFRGGRSVAELAAAKDLISAQEALLLQTEQSIMLDTVIAYMDVLYDKAFLELARNNYNVIERQMEETQARFDVGELTLTDVSQAKSRLAAAHADIIQGEGDLQSDAARLEELSGYIPQNYRRPAFDLALPQTMSEMMELADKRNPAILAAKNLDSAADNDVDNVFGELLPQVFLTARWARSYDPQPGLIDEETTRSVTLNADIPLYQGGAVYSRLRESKEISSQRYMELKEARRYARQQTVSAWKQYEIAKATIEARKTQVDAASIAREGVKEEELAGLRTILDTLDAEQEYLQAQVDMLAAERNEIIARFSLAAILGELTVENLSMNISSRSNSYKHVVKKRILNTDVDRLTFPD